MEWLDYTYNKQSVVDHDLQRDLNTSVDVGFLHEYMQAICLNLSNITYTSITGMRYQAATQSLLE